jgi:hypothetical protein
MLILTARFMLKTLQIRVEYIHLCSEDFVEYTPFRLKVETSGVI